jgi:hypothetical protein
MASSGKMMALLMEESETIRVKTIIKVKNTRMNKKGAG